MVQYSTAQEACLSYDVVTAAFYVLCVGRSAILFARRSPKSIEVECLRVGSTLEVLT